MLMHDRCKAALQHLEQLLHGHSIPDIATVPEFARQPC